MTRRRTPDRVNVLDDPATWTPAYLRKRARLKNPYAPEMRRRRLAQKGVEAAMRALPLQWLSESYLSAAPSLFPTPKKGMTERQLQLEAERRRRRAVSHYKTYIPVLAERYVHMALDQRPTPPPPARSKVEAGIKKVEEMLKEALLYLAGPEFGHAAFAALERAIEEEPPAETLVMAPELMKFEQPLPSLGRFMVHLETVISAARRAKIPETAKDARGRDRKVDALEIAKVAASDFHTLTGQAPTRARGEGKYLHFLAAVFDALGRRDDSVANLGRSACRWWRERRPGEEQEFLEALMATKPPDDFDGIRVVTRWSPPVEE